MRIVFITNYMTPHQLPFCEEMYARLKDNFIFIYTTPMEEERKKMGWGMKIETLSYVWFYDDDYEGNASLIMESDVVICGGTHFMYIENRVRAGKLTFRYFERLYKKGRIYAFHPGSYIRKIREHTKYKKSPVYLLCAGAYVPADFHMFGAYTDKMYKWGYFPKTKVYDYEQLYSKKMENEILWTGRMIDWKHPETVIEIAKKLIEKNVTFHITMIGEGNERTRIEELIACYKLSGMISIKDFMTPKEVREYMEKSQIYLMTSDQQEGWGAVVNEAMNSGCVTIGSIEAGSVPYLIKDKTNGFMVPSGDIDAYVNTLEKVLLDQNLCKQIGNNAYKTIKDEWNEENAAQRFLDLCAALTGKTGKNFSDGILSKAEVITVGQNLKKFKRI